MDKPLMPCQFFIPGAVFADFPEKCLEPAQLLQLDRGEAMNRAHIAIAALLVGMPAISSAVPIIREFGGNQDPASILGTVN
ncbi:MAG TPA: hypothetical protein VLA73_01785, partial [Burkholderiales bacterium]|nr:hypothetical protein [Burkholderiales bacterium]